MQAALSPKELAQLIAHEQAKSLRAAAEIERIRAGGKFWTSAAAEAYGDWGGVIDRNLDSPDPYMKAVAEALIAAAPKFEHAAVPEIGQAFGIVERLRAAGVSYEDFVDGKTPIEASAPVRGWVGLLYDVDPNRPDIGAEVQRVLERRAAAPAAPNEFRLKNETEDTHARRLAISALDRGQSVVVHPEIVARAAAIAAEMGHVFPEGVQVGVLERIEHYTPSDPKRYRGVFRTPSGGVFTTRIIRDAVREMGASFGSRRQEILIYRLGAIGGATLGMFDKRLRGELYHEAVHAISDFGLLGDDRARLLRHTESLDVMGFPVADYMHIKTGGEYPRVGSLRDAYADLYKNCDDPEYRLEEESLAIFVELVSHGVVDEADIAPVRDILDGIFSGRYAGKKDARQAELGGARQSFENLKTYVDQTAARRSATRPAPIRRDMPPPGSGAADRMARLLSPFERENDTLSDAEFRRLAGTDPYTAQHYRQIPIESERGAWHSPISLAVQKILHDRYVELSTGSFNSWAKDAEVIDRVWSSLPLKVRLAAEQHVHRNWAEWFDSTVFALSGADAGPEKIKALGGVVSQLQRALGMPRVASGETPYRVAVDLDKMMQEGGRYLDGVLGDTLKADKEAHRDELEQLSDPRAGDELADGFAKFFDRYIADPAAARRAAPGFFHAFEETVDARNPGLLVRLERLQIALAQPGVRSFLRAAAADPHFTGTFGTAREPLFEFLGRRGEEYRQAAEAAQRFNADPAALDAYLNGLPDHLRAHALFSRTRETAQLHPVIRATKIAEIAHQMATEISAGRLRDTSSRDAAKLEMGGAKAQEVNDLLMQHAAIELHNGFMLAGDPEFSGRDAVHAGAALDALKDRAPEIAGELERRLKKANVQAWSTAKQFYPEVARRVESGWREAYDAEKFFGAKDARQAALKTGAGNEGSPPQPPRGSGIPGKVAKDDFARKFANFWKRNFQPERISDAALRADPRFAQYKAASAREKDAIVRQGDEAYARWAHVPERDQIDYLNAVETGRTDRLPEWQRREAARHRALLNKAFEDEQAAGSRAEFVAEYMPHIWAAPDRWRALAEQLRTAENVGPTWFQKARYVDLIKQGLDHGLKLKTTNPENLVTLRLLAGADMRQRMDLLHDLDEDYGLATPAKDAAGDLVKQGWRIVNAPDREQWLLAPDIHALWNNAVQAKGLWANGGVPGTLFRAWMAFKNVWTPVKLSMSLFHPLHVLHINTAQQFARAWVEATNGRFYDAAQDIVRIGDLYPKIGREARAAWLTPEGERTRAEDDMVRLMEEGGFSPQLSEQLKIAASRQLQKALAEKNIVGVPWYGAKRLLEVTQGVIFEKWIPNLKAAAYLRDVASFAARNPDAFSDPIQRKAGLRAIAKSIDNRYGEMFYGSLFWNRTLKDAGTGAFLSLGWNLGFAREFGGGLISPILQAKDRVLGGEASETRQTIRDAQNKTSFILSYVASAMALCGLMTYMLTGDQPEGLDFIFPRIGGLNPDGSRRRLTTMFYTREFPMWRKHVEEQGGGVHGTIAGTGDMLFNKLLFQPFVEMAQNRDYYGHELYDINAPEYRQAYQFATKVFKEQFSPITISGASRALETGGSWSRDVPLAMLGFGPAPSYAARTATQNRIGFLYQRFVSPNAAPLPEEPTQDAQRQARQDYRLAAANKDETAKAKAIAEIAKTGAEVPTLPGDILMFHRLPVSSQRAILNSAPEEEARRYALYANRALWADSAFMRSHMYLFKKPLAEAAPAH